jgi:6-phosphogluconolactonase (cycloisomerase 2 family)
MRLSRTLVLALLVALAARPATAGRILYATAATPGRVDGFCINNDGSLATTPTVSISMRRGQDPVHSEPRRLLVGQAANGNGVLYVAEVDRVEVYRIDARGGLRWIGGTSVEDNMRPLDLALSADGKVLYVPQQIGKHRVAAYPLDDEGAPSSVDHKPTSCALGPVAASFQNVIVNGSLLYVTAQDTPGRVDVFQIGPDGNLKNPFPDGCENFATTKARTDAVTGPISTRHGLNVPKALALRDGVLYVEERGNNRIRAFRLHSDGHFDEPVKKFPSRPKSTALKFQKIESTTAHGLAYEAILLQENSLIASNFGKARIDTFLLRPGGKLPQTPRVTSTSDIRMTPVRIAVDRNTLYVAAGEFDRVVAYRLQAKNGLLAATTPFSETNEQTGSFPNDVAVAMLAQQCQ